jgi:hypothetical protein
MIERSPTAQVRQQAWLFFAGRRPIESVSGVELEVDVIDRCVLRITVNTIQVDDGMRG